MQATNLQMEVVRCGGFLAQTSGQLFQGLLSIDGGDRENVNLPFFNDETKPFPKVSLV